MEKLKNEIHRIKRHRLDYYHSHLDVVGRYIDEKPDISIETCKAIIEGISKLSLHVLKQEPLSNLNNQKLSPLVKQALRELQEGRGFSDFDLCNRLATIVEYIGTLRNDHSDISHGRASLKEQLNDADLAEMVVGITDNLCTYMLRRLDYLSESVVEYEDNPDFNTELDELNPLNGNVLYSRALFDQEQNDYEIQLEEYKLRIEEEA